jgi:ABC-2 type transport system permease protein
MTTQAATVERPRFRPNPVTLGLLRGRLEIGQFFRARASMVFSFALPIGILVIFGSIFKQNLAPGVTFTQYFVAGMIATSQLTNGFQTLAIQIPIERDRGVLKRLAGTPMPRSSYFLGKIIVVYVAGILGTALALLIAVLFFGVHLPSSGEKWFTFLWVSVLGIAACTLCGIAFSSVAKDGKSAPAIATPPALALQFISGVFIIFSDLPGWMRVVASIFPLKWMAQGMRSVFLPDSFQSQEIGHSWQLGRVALVLGAWVVAGLILCLLTFRWTAKEDR